jgi:NADPH:quinone reductase-like Zn-dependent oxidoreductase
MADARAFWICEPGRGEIRDVTLPPLGAGDVRVRTCYTAISRGTEALVFAGRVPPSEQERMRAPFQEGAFPGPLKYGYINVGVVEDGPADLRGRAVFTLYPHQTRFVVPATAVRPLPDGLPVERAVLAANMETALNGLWDAAPAAGDCVAVIGAGAVGCLVARLMRSIPGVSCTLADINPSRAAVAAALGVAFAHPDDLRREATLVVHTSGSPAGLRRALDIAVPESTIVEMSWFGDREVSLPLGEAFHAGRLTLKSSQVGMIPLSRRAQWTYASRLQLALELLSDDALDILVTGEDAFEDLPAVMPRVAADGGGTICHRIRY